MSRASRQSDLWKHFGNEFEQLAGEEERLERAAPKDRLLRAYCDYKEHPAVWERGKPEQGCFCLLKAPETGLWTYSDGVSENFQARFRALAARAGVARGCPKDTDPEDFWLHRLYLDLLENNSDLLFAASEEGGMIVSVCVASATFCSRLERKALATDGGEQRRNAIVGAQHNSTMADVQQSEPGEHNVPTSQPADQKLRDVILQKKARIVKIECTLGRPQEEASRLRLGEEREHLVAEVEELEAELREALVDRAIASRKRMETSVMPEGPRYANPSALDAMRSRALLGIDLSAMENLRREVWRKFFFDEARLPRAMEVEWEETLSSREIPDSHVDLALTFALTKEYVKAISRASRQLADLLATAAVSRIGQADFREAIWRECLDFAYQLGQWDAFASWVDRVAGIRWKAPVTADGTTDLEQLEKAAKPRREFFENRIGMYPQEWLSAIDQAIELRLTVSAPRTVNSGGEIEKRAPGIASAPSRTVPTPSKKRDPEVAKRRALVKSNAGVSVHELCQIFDRENVPLPVKWQAAGLKTWVEAHRKYATRVKVIVSKDRSSD